MPIELKMPALSPTMEEGTLAKWLVKEGDAVKSGDILAEIETDKATMEFEAVDEGTIAKIVVPEGTDGVKVGAVIAIMAGEGEDASAAPRRRRPSRRKVDAPAPSGDRNRSSSRATRRPRSIADVTPHQMETAARDLVAAVARTPGRRAGRAGGHRDGPHRPSARRCATRWPRRCARTSASS